MYFGMPILHKPLSSRLLQKKKKLNSEIGNISHFLE